MKAQIFIIIMAVVTLLLIWNIILEVRRGYTNIRSKRTEHAPDTTTKSTTSGSNKTRKNSSSDTVRRDSGSPLYRSFDEVSVVIEAFNEEIENLKGHFRWAEQHIEKIEASKVIADHEKLLSLERMFEDLHADVLKNLKKINTRNYRAEQLLGEWEERKNNDVIALSENDEHQSDAFFQQPGEQHIIRRSE